MAKSKNDNELRLVRAFSAPVELVWEAFTNEKHQQKWWGPRGFTITTKSKDLRVGGKWIYTMHSPDGVDYPNITTYYEVVENSRLVYDHGANENQDALFRVTVTFEEFKGRTVMDMTMTLKSPEAAREIEKFIKQAGGNSTWDRLGEFLEKEQTEKDIFVINRSFKCSKSELYEMWVKPEHLLGWLAPKGVEMKVIDADIREGGSMHFSMAGPEGPVMYGVFNYLELIPGEKIIYSQSFCDEDKNKCNPPFAKDWPPTILNTIVFSSEDGGETRVTLQTEAIGEVTSDEVRSFLESRPSMSAGWSSSFDSLEELIFPN